MADEDKPRVQEEVKEALPNIDPRAEREFLQDTFNVEITDATWPEYQDKYEDILEHFSKIGFACP